MRTLLTVWILLESFGRFADCIVTTRLRSRHVRTGPVFTPGSDTIGVVHLLHHAPPGGFLPQRFVPGLPVPVPRGIQGVALLLHACGRNARDWFELPEEREMSQQLLARGFVLVAPDTQQNAPGGCWIPATETQLVRIALTQFVQERGLVNLPVYGFGASSGGLLLSALVGAGIEFAGVHFNVSPGDAKAGRPGTFVKPGHPPTSFVYMSADSYASPDDVRTAESALAAVHTPVQLLEVQPKPASELGPRAEQLGFSSAEAALLVQTLRSWNLIENRYGEDYLVPSTSDVALGRLTSDPVWSTRVTPISKAVWEELHVVEGIHCPTSEFFKSSIEFLLNAANRSISSAHKAAPVSGAIASRGAAPAVTSPPPPLAPTAPQAQPTPLPVGLVPPVPTMPPGFFPGFQTTTVTPPPFFFPAMIASTTSPVYTFATTTPWLLAR